MRPIVFGLAAWALLGLTPPQTPPAPNSEIAQLAAADQSERTNWISLTTEERASLAARDEARRKRVAELLSADALSAPEDFDRAALIFQHGTTTDDYEVARELAIVAFAKGRPTSLPALAEDRFLVKIGRPQRFGSQFKVGTSGTMEMEKVDESGAAAVTDPLRLDSMQPPLAILREQSTQAVEASMDQILARMAERLDPAWQGKALETPESKELGELVRGSHNQSARARVLELVRTDKLGPPIDYVNAARILTTASEPATRLLANELAAVAAMRRHPRAGRVFAETWDRFLGGIGRPTRYGTRGTNNVRPTVAPAVRRLFGLPI